jgi:cytosine/adenosine deaminase-related metal-dependent hydrolase
LHFQNFVEVLSITDASAHDRLAHYQSVLDSFNSKQVGRSSLSPHASYTVSRTAFEIINDATEEKLISIHNQETPAEDHLYETGDSDFLGLYKLFGINGSPFTVTGKSSIRSYLPFFNKGQKIILVHNTFMPEEDIQWANDYAQQAGISLVYCFCVNANLYIEDKLPPIGQFMKNNCPIVIGTDSYSSNTELKISHEISSIATRYPTIPIATILQWATKNGAEALGIESTWITGSKLLEKLAHRS